MADYLIICADREGDRPDHAHIEKVGVRVADSASTLRVLHVAEVRQRIKDKADRFFTNNPMTGGRARVKRYKCGECGRKTIRTKPDDVHDDNLSRLRPC